MGVSDGGGFGTQMVATTVPNARRGQKASGARARNLRTQGGAHLIGEASEPPNDLDVCRVLPVAIRERGEDEHCGGVAQRDAVRVRAQV